MGFRFNVDTFKDAYGEEWDMGVRTLRCMNFTGPFCTAGAFPDRRTVRYRLVLNSSVVR